MAEPEISPHASKALPTCASVFPNDVPLDSNYNHIQKLIQMQAASQTQRYAKPRGGATITKREQEHEGTSDVSTVSGLQLL